MFQTNQILKNMAQVSISLTDQHVITTEKNSLCNLCIRGRRYHSRNPGQDLNDPRQLEVFPRIDGAVPFILIDGHLTRLNPLFLAYVNNPEHKWKVCLGVTYVTTLCQLGNR